MPASTAKGFPYSQGSDGAGTIDDTMQALATAVDVWFDPISTAQRDLLTTPQKPDGRIIYNTTTKRHELWVAASSRWKPLVQSRRYYSIL